MTVGASNRAHAAFVEASIAQLAADMKAGVDRMILTQMEAYPPSWSEEDKREMAELHLFGREQLS